MDQEGAGGLELAFMLWLTVGGFFLVLGAVELIEGRGIHLWLALGVAIGVGASVVAGYGPVRALRSHPVEHRAQQVARKTAVVLLALLLVAVAGGWLYSHLEPDSFGECKLIALSVGPNPTITECQAYGASDFLVPFVAVALLLVLVSGDGDLTITIPWLGEVKKSRETKEAVKLAEDPTDRELLDQRGERFVRTVKPGNPTSG